MNELERACDAIFSPCRTYRYVLRRRWDWSLPFCAFIGLNPSTADETKDDPTIRRCIRFAKEWGYGGLVMLNIFAFRATDPRDMLKADDPIGPQNDYHLMNQYWKSGIVIAAWGTKGGNRADEVTGSLPTLHCLVKTKDGHPKHPLYVAAETKPVIYSVSHQPRSLTDERTERE